MDPKLRKQRELTDQIKLDIVGFLEAPSGYVGNERRHQFWELMYIGRGSGFIACRNTEVPFAATDLLLMEPDERHCVHFEGPGDLEMLYVGFTMDFDPGFRLVNEIPVNLYPGNTKHVVKDMLRHVLEHMKNDAMDSVVAVCSILYALSILIHTIAADDPDRVDRAEAVDKAKAYLEQNVHRGISVGEIAGHVHLSDRYCSTLFKEAFGVTPKQYHTSLRMTLAAELLKNKNTTENVSEIADRLGYSSIHYFSKTFKEHFGTSPTRFKELGGES